jgi:hypothetical protein
MPQEHASQSATATGLQPSRIEPGRKKPHDVPSSSRVNEPLGQLQLVAPPVFQSPRVFPADLHRAGRLADEFRYMFQQIDPKR